MASDFILRIFDVEHGACAIMLAPNDRIAMIDCGHNSSTGWRPSWYIRYVLKRTSISHLFVTNADRDHLSDCAGLSGQGVTVDVLHRNALPSPTNLHLLKLAEGPLSEGVERFIDMHYSYWSPCVPFNDGMGGVTCATYCNSDQEFSDTNNLSMATFIKYAGFKFLFPGDLEKSGWKALLRNPAFVAELKYTDVLVASHHGRENGYCDEIFEHFNPQLVVISDTGIKYASQETVPDYQYVVRSPDGVPVSCGGQIRQRHVLTTRNDGDIIFQIPANGLLYTSTVQDKYGKKVA